MLSWPSVAAATSYNVYLGKSETFTESDLEGSVSDGLFLGVEQELEPGTYYWTVDVVTKDTVYEGIKWMFYVAMKPRDPDPTDGIGRVRLPLLILLINPRF